MQMLVEILQQNENISYLPKSNQILLFGNFFKNSDFYGVILPFLKGQVKHSCRVPELKYFNVLLFDRKAVVGTETFVNFCKGSFYEHIEI